VGSREWGVENSSIRLKLVFTISLLLLFFACSEKKEKENIAPIIEESFDVTPSLEEIDREHAARIASSMDDRQLAAQVIITGIDGKGSLTRDMRILLSECPAGGIMLFRYNLTTDNDAIQKLIAESVALITEGLPPAVSPFVVVDHEGGKSEPLPAGSP